ncbi:2'-5' RNA ligase family protein [Rhizobium phaseoli]|uniref:2'-5' RNA ligase family protein n=1 Tax=Rhizobium phaseoli TaxID=396 RepID=UPI003AAB4390
MSAIWATACPSFSKAKFWPVSEDLRAAFRPWLGPQDLQPWRPHVTVQNRVHWQKADTLYDMLSSEFVRRTLLVEGFDLWSYMQGPWRHEHFFGNGQTTDQPR